jgi:hypothetical protein
MYRQDYILRLIERLGAALGALRNRILRRAGEEAAIQAEIGEIARQAGLDIDVARKLDPDLLLAWLAPTGEPDPARLWLMAELLYLTGLQSKGAGESPWPADFERALALLIRLPPDWRPGDSFATADERVTEIRGLLGVEQDGR